MTRLAGLLVALLLAAAPAGPAAGDPLNEPTDPSITDGTAQRELDAARARWAERGSDDYSFRLRITCFCPESVTAPKLITVDNGKPAVKVGATHRRYATVTRMFKRIQEAIGEEVAVLDVTYGGRGIPRHVYIDRSPMIVDEEIGFTARKYQEL